MINKAKHFSEVWNNVRKRMPEDCGVEFVSAAAWVSDIRGHKVLAKLNEILRRENGMWVTVDGEPVTLEIAYWHPIPKLYDMEYIAWKGDGGIFENVD